MHNVPFLPTKTQGKRATTPLLYILLVDKEITNPQASYACAIRWKTGIGLSKTVKRRLRRGPVDFEVTLAWGNLDHMADAVIVDLIAISLPTSSNMAIQHEEVEVADRLRDASRWKG